MIGRRHAAAVLLTTAATWCVGGTAYADPPGPTDYRSSIVSITPAVPGLSARIIGGDSFFQLTVDDSAAVDEVIVVGYRGEPYLRFLRGGQVQENELAPSRLLNTSRYATATEPADDQTDPDAEPVWRTVAHHGQWAWHDHRIHWMSTVHPLGRHPGDQILEAVIPLLVDGTPVSVTVISTWMPAPSNLPAALGALFGVGLGLVAIGSGRRGGVQWPVPAALATAATGALVVGLWQTWSVPGQTGPPITAWALPLTAIVIAVGGAVRRWSAFTSLAISIVGAAQLLLWVVLRRDVLTRAILPTNAPFWLDRAVSAGVGIVALVIGTTAVAALVPPLLRPR